MRHVWTVLCKRALVDERTNSVSLIDAIEGVTGKGPAPKPAILPFEATLAQLWARSEVGEPEKGRARMRILSPKGKELHSSEYEVDLSAHERRRHFLSMQGLPYEEAGRYEMVSEMELDDAWKEVSRYPVDIAVEVVEQDA